MKHYLHHTAITVAMLAIATGAQAQTEYLQTSFDDGMPAAFTLIDHDQRTPQKEMRQMGFETGRPWIVVNEGSEGNRAAVSTSYYEDSGRASDWMITPPMTVSSPKAVLRWRSRAQAQDFPDGLTVYVAPSSSDPQPSSFSTTLYRSSAESHRWTDHEVSLADYVGQTIRVAFVNESNDCMCLYVDDIFAGVPTTVGMTLDFDRTYNGYGRIAVSGTAYATSDDDVEGFTIGLRTPDATLEQHFDATLHRGQPLRFELSDSLALDRFQSTDYDAWIKAGADSAGLSGRVTAVPWRIVVEEMTGTWCAWCVRGIGAMERLSQLYPDHFIGIAIHNNSKPGSHPDAMAIRGEDYLRWVMSQYGLTGFPSCVINRQADYAGDPLYLVEGFESLKQTNDYDTGIQLAATYDPSTQRIATTTAIFPTRPTDGSGLRLFFVVTEDNVHHTYDELGVSGERSGYDQQNAYAGGTEACYGFEQRPGNIAADDMWFQDVARGTEPASDFSGLRNVFPRALEAETLYSYDHTFPLPTTVDDPQQASVVVMLIDKDGRLLNADRARLTVASPEAIRHAAPATTPRDSQVYNLQGQRLTHPHKGINIVDGKKYVGGNQF